MYLVKHTSFETFFQVREIRPGPACHIGVIDVRDILRDRWHGGPWWPWLVTSASCPKAGWMSKGEPTSYHNRPVDKTQLLLQLQFWVQHEWTNQLWVPQAIIMAWSFSHSNKPHFPILSYGKTHDFPMNNLPFMGKNPSSPRLGAPFGGMKTRVYGRFTPIAGYSWHIVDYGFCWWYIELVHGLINQQT